MNIGVIDFLNQFDAVTPQDIQLLMSQATTVNFNKKEIITEIGEKENHIGLITKGLVRKYFFKGNEEVITHIAKEGQIISSSASFFSGKPSAYRLETMEPTTILRVCKSCLNDLFASDKKWEKVGRLIASHYLVLQEYRLMDNIRYSTRERFIKFMNENPDLIQRVPQKYLASYLNIKPETFSRLKQLMYENS